MIVLYIIIGVMIGSLTVFAFMRQRSVRLLNDLSQKYNSEKAEQEKRMAVVETQLTAERSHHEKEIKAVEDRAEQSIKLMREEIKLMAQQMLKETRTELNDADKERLDSIISPLKERMEAFSKAVNDNSRDNATHKTEIKTAFEEAMKFLHSEQERTVRQLKEQTEKIGQGAEQLTKALKGDSKLQGDWGEMILDTTLENCGLKKDEQYFLQENYKGKDGNNLRPDAVVLFPNNERIIIDSKVSLTAYQQAFKTDDESERERLLKEHVASVKRHVEELTEKNYDKYVPNSIGYVLMFIPYESGYAAAVKSDPSLLQYAYRKKIIIISPANLLMTLQLTHTMWQNFRMNKNVEEIMRQSSDLYDKFVTFAESFVRIEKDIETLHSRFNTARGQLNEGKGNIIRRLELMKQLGVNPKKEIPETLIK